MKILITGSNGQLGQALLKQLSVHNLIPINRDDCDLINLDKIKHTIDQNIPDLIINTAAYTNVDQAEEDKDIAFKINNLAPKIMAEKALELNIPLIHFSTDYVFDGEKSEGYIETDLENPLGVYGESKLAGDQSIQNVGGQFYIFRTSWIYSSGNNNFASKIKKLSFKHDALKVVSDQFGVPTSAEFIAKSIFKIIPRLKNNNVGIYHLVPDGQSSWYEFAKLIIGSKNPKFNLQNLSPISSDLYQGRAKRPKNSILNNQKIKDIFSLDIESWEKYYDEL